MSTREELIADAKMDEYYDSLEAVMPELPCVCTVVSGCCSAPPLQIEVLENNRPSDGEPYAGTCSTCKENIIFWPLEDDTTWKLVGSGYLGRDEFDKAREHDWECSECGREEITSSNG